MQNKNLDEWLSYLEQRYTAKIDLGLERVQALAKKLDIASFSCPVITVAGTNGKGSSVAFLEHILRAAGYKVATYTSPHLVNFTERIKVDGKEIGADSLCGAFAEIYKAAEDNYLTYFEFTTLAALYVFKKADLDAIILEVGLGGRLDAVNIVDPDVAVIATISIDHTEYLGFDREKIGYEKAGIMRPGKPVTGGDFDLPQSIINHAKEIEADLYRIGHDFQYQVDGNSWSWQSKKTQLHDLPLPKLPLQNAANVLMTLELINSKLPISRDALNKGLAQAELMGRFQQLRSNPEVIVDVAHNPESGAFLARQLREKHCSGRIFAVVGMLKDKDIYNTLYPLSDLISDWYVTDLDNPRGAKAEYLKQQIQAFTKKSCYTHGSVLEAYNHALSSSATADRIIVFGSFYTVAEIYKSMANDSRSFY